jgi:DNA repair protein RadC
LAPANARRWACLLIDRLGSLSAVLSAESDVILNLVRDERLPPLLSAISLARLHALRTEVSNQPILENTEALINYLMAAMASSRWESLRVLFLNGANRLLADENFGMGSVNAMKIYPRTILKRALDLGSTALILVHNHPSGDPRPSTDDIESTRAMIRAAHTLDIAVHDHLIVASNGWTSLRAMGII